MARSQKLSVLVALLVAQAATAATPARRLTQAVEVNNTMLARGAAAPRATALSAGARRARLLDALRNATRLPAGSHVKAVVKSTPEGFSLSSGPLSIDESQWIDDSIGIFLLPVPDVVTDCTITDVDVTVEWVKCEGAISEQGTCDELSGPARSDTIFMFLNAEQTDGNFVVGPTLVDTDTYGPGPEPGESFSVTFDDVAPDPVGGGDPVSGTFSPLEPALFVFNNLQAQGLRFELAVADFVEVENLGDPIALKSWSLTVTCAQPDDQGEPPCDEGNFIGPGANFWGPKTKPGSDDLVTQADPAIGGWPDVCAKAFDACQAETTDPAVFDTTCGCALWACLNPCFAKECPVTGEGPVCPPQGLRAYYCNKLKHANAICGDDAPALPNDCDSLAPAAAAAAKRARRNRA